MALRDCIFPATRHPDLVQTEWADGWGEAVSGFGHAASFLTENRARFGARIDQLGIAIFFLQRHRVELALKGLMHAVVGRAPVGHNLHKLWKTCEQKLQPLDPDEWEDFATQYRELIDVIHWADASSTAFRYPVKLGGSTAARPAFIDLEALNEAAENFEYGVDGYIDYWTEQRQASS